MNPSLLLKSRNLGWIYAVLGALCFSGKAIVVKLAYQYGSDAVTLLMLRMLLALPFFIAITVWAQRKRKGVAPAKLSGRDQLGIVGLGFTGYYLASFLDFAGLAYISAALERLILYLNPTLVMLLGWLLYRRPIQARQWLGMAVGYGGMVLMFGHEVRLLGSTVALGAGLVFLSALSYAVYLSYSGELVRRLGAMRLVGWASCVACVLCIAQYAFLRPWADVFAVAPQVLGLSLLNATVCTVVPIVLVMLAIERIGAGAAAQMGMLGPVATIAMGALLLNETVNAWVFAGTGLVLLGIFICSRARPQAHN